MYDVETDLQRSGGLSPQVFFPRTTISATDGSESHDNYDFLELVERGRRHEVHLSSTSNPTRDDWEGLAELLSAPSVPSVSAFNTENARMTQHGSACGI